VRRPGCTGDAAPIRCGWQRPTGAHVAPRIGATCLRARRQRRWSGSFQSYCRSLGAHSAPFTDAASIPAPADTRAGAVRSINQATVRVARAASACRQAPHIERTHRLPASNPVRTILNRASPTGARHIRGACESALASPKLNDAYPGASNRRLKLTRITSGHCRNSMGRAA
jgi:hypothetical protein